jgi:hypothetical protein
MPWHPIDPAVPGEVIAASWHNEQLGDNITYLKTHGPALPGQQANDFIYAQNADTLTRQPAAQACGPYFLAGAWGQHALTRRVGTFPANGFVYAYDGDRLTAQSSIEAAGPYFSGGVWAQHTLTRRVANFPVNAFVHAYDGDRLTAQVAVERAIPCFQAGVWSQLLALGLHELFLPCTAFRPGKVNPCGPLEQFINPVGNVDVVGLPFPKAAMADAVATISLPKAWNNATTIYAECWQFAGPGGGAGTVRWDTVIGGGGGGQYVNLGASQQPWCLVPQLGDPFVLAIGPRTPIVLPVHLYDGGNNLLYLTVRRPGPAAPDAFAGTAYFAGIKLFVQTKALTDD